MTVIDRSKKIDKAYVRRMHKRAYVNPVDKSVKVILREDGEDVFQIVFDGSKGGNMLSKGANISGESDATAAMSSVSLGRFNMKDVEPAVICVNVKRIRSELKRLGEELAEILADDTSNGKRGFYRYSEETERKSWAKAWEIANLKNSGISRM